MVLNRKGQAALTDAIYFLMIVSGLSVLMFYFTSGYGSSLDEQIELQYKTEYATSSLKTILYMNVAREPGKKVVESEEVDYLLAVLKEDYADCDSAGAAGPAPCLSDDVKKKIARNVESVMSPLRDSFDYVYYIQDGDSGDFVIALLSARAYVDASGCACDPLSDSACLDALGPCNNPVVPEKKIWICGPDNINSIEINLLRNVGTVSRAPIVRVFLAKLEASGVGDYWSNNRVKAYSSLAMWPSQPVFFGNPGDYIKSEFESGREPIIIDQAPFSCEELDLS